ncbi:MAG: carbamoyltransferase HypF, partial [Bacteroidota bacterium]|nr:carbamoyltransferase HypF [Bacteroidota bacterium]
SEYENIHDRRFHAQPVACNECGPHYSLWKGEDRIIEDTDTMVSEIRKMLREGKIIAMKGIGGFHLACNAQDEYAVSRLRSKKNREGKPFAVMFSGLDEVRRFAFTGEKEEKCLTSWRRPIVILDSKPSPTLAPSVSNGLKSIGAMLPYMPFHYLLLNEPGLPAMVLTSGNISDEPIITENEEALKRLKPVADAVLVYNRDIANRSDDSVVRVIAGEGRVVRRSRGFVPEPIRLDMNVEGIIATGAELMGCLAVGKDHMAILSQHIGDMTNPETCEFFEETLNRFTRLFRVTPAMIVSDLHPDYFTTRFAEKFAGKVLHVQVQHHHAHIASCMAEYGISQRVIGIAMDGTGYGTDGHIWGAEFLECDLAGFDRHFHFEYIPLPGGDKGIEEPWRTAVSYLFHAYGDKFLSLGLPLVKEIGEEKIRLVMKMIDLKINCPLVSSAGRLFDVVAALTGICNVSLFHAEAPMRLEALLIKDINEEYPYHFDGIFRFSETIKAIVSDILAGIEPGRISAKFHNTMISVIFNGAASIREATGLNRVVLSGGTFQNRYLLEGAEKRLKAGGFQVVAPCRIPANDGGIALGQLVIASRMHCM